MTLTRRARRRPPEAEPPPHPGPHTMPWWASPTGICLGFLLPILVLIAYVGTINHPAITIRGVRFLTLPYLLLAASMLLVMAGGGWMGSLIVNRKMQPVHGGDLMRATNILGLVALLIYCLWLRGLLFNPLTVFQVFTGQFRPNRAEIGTGGGVRSLLNFSLVFFCFASYGIFVLRVRADRLCKFLIVALSLLTLYRSYLWSERLALIEILVPVVLAWTLSRPRKLAWAWQATRRFGPFGGIPFVVLYFAVGEYFRSWQSEFYQSKHLNFADFAVGRLASYYYTSLNNGAGVLATGNWPNYAFDSILQWLHKMPLGVGTLFKRVIGYEGSSNMDFLEEFGDAEFNNPSGIFQVVGDIGIGPAALYFWAVAFVAAMLLRRYERANIVGIALFPAFFMSFVEVFRYPYLGQSRAFSYVMAALLGVAIVSYLGRQRSRRQQLADRAQRFRGAPLAPRVGVPVGWR